MRAWCVVLLFLLSFQRVYSITAGQKMAIQKVPFIALGEGRHNGEYRRFSGVILDEKMVLTLAVIAQSYTNLTVKVGVADLKSSLSAKAYRVRRGQHNDYLAILEILGGPLPIGTSVQRASFAPYSDNLLPEQMYFVAGYGSLNNNPTYPNELHARPVYLTYKDVPIEQRPSRFLMADKSSQNLVLQRNDMGGPVWNIDTGEVVGFILPVQADLGGGRIRQVGLPAAYHWPWIHETRSKMHVNEHI